MNALSAEAMKPSLWRIAWVLLMAGLGGWLYLGLSGGVHLSRRPSDLYAVQLQSWCDGHTYLDNPAYVPDPRLARLKNPYDGRLNQPYRLLDLCYYNHRYYSPFGVTPILLFGLPWHLIFGGFLEQGTLVLLFVYGSLLLSLFLLVEIWRGYLSDVSFSLVAVAAGILTFGNLAILHLLAGNFYQVAQSSANFCQLASLAAGLLALRSSRHWRGWLGLASLAAGLAVASRPSFLVGGISLLPICAVIAAKLRRGRPSRSVGWCWADPLLTAAIPAALIGAGLLWYNSVRFGSALEFGGSYILAGTDPREVKLFSLRYVGRNIAAFLSNPASLSHYFPFFRGTAYPVGLFYFPFILLVGGTVLAAGARIRRRYPELMAITLALLLAAIGNFAVLALFVESWLRYEVDFFVPLLLTATLGWLLLHRSLPSTAMARAISMTAGVLLGLVTQVDVLLVSAALGPSTRFAMVAPTIDRLVGLIDAARGYVYGPVHLRLALPKGAINEPQRLISSGPLGGDWVYVQSAAHGKIRLGYDHAGIGGPVSEPFDPGQSAEHTVDITMGSLLPAEDQGFFDGWSESAIYHAKHLLSVSWDGAEVLRSSCEFDRSGPGEIRLGTMRSDPTVNQRSAISILSVEHRRFDQRTLAQAAADYEGYARFKIRFPANRAERREPLLATGEGGAADLLFVHYLADGRLRFGVDDWNGELFEGDPVAADLGPVHSAYLSFGSLSGGKTAGREFVLVLDGRVVAAARFAFHPADPGSITWGLNSVHSSVAGEMFSGTLAGIAPITKAEFEAHYFPAPTEAVRPVDGKITLQVRFDYTHSAGGQPLIVTGKEGAGDFVYVMYDNDRQIHFGFDHWGGAGLIGPPVALDFSQPHLVVVAMASLVGSAAAAKPGPAPVRVMLDGRTVLAGQSLCHPTSLEEIEVGRNEIGGSTCAKLFSGRILAINGRN